MSILRLDYVFCEIGLFRVAAGLLFAVALDSYGQLQAESLSYFASHQLCSSYCWNCIWIVAFVLAFAGRALLVIIVAEYRSIQSKVEVRVNQLLRHAFNRQPWRGALVSSISSRHPRWRLQWRMRRYVVIRVRVGDGDTEDRLNSAPKIP